MRDTNREINPNHFYVTFQGIPYTSLDSAVKWGDRMLAQFTVLGRGRIAMVFEEDAQTDNLWYCPIDDKVEVVEVMSPIPPNQLGQFFD